MPLFLRGLHRGQRDIRAQLEQIYGCLGEQEQAFGVACIKICRQVAASHELVLVRHADARRHARQDSLRQRSKLRERIVIEA